MLRKIPSLFLTPLFLFIFSTFPSFAATYPRGDGKIRLYNYALNEFLEVQFRDASGLSPSALKQIHWLLRSRDNHQTIEIDPKLLDLVDHLQDHFQVDTVEIISGFRRPELNEKLLATGHKVSPKSLHMKGQAMDIHLDEISEERLRDYLLGLKLGGVGYYGPLDFVHVDTGEVSSWGEPLPRKRPLIGVLQPKAAVQLTSDRNDYFPQDTLLFTWQAKNPQDLKRIQQVELQRFSRGEWKACPVSANLQETTSLPSASLLCGGKNHALGKYRWVFRLAGESGILSSNEFYLKRE